MKETPACRAATSPCSGGAGNDIFVFNTLLNQATNKDTITDFAPGQDKIELDKTIFTTLPGEGTIASHFLANTSGTAADDNDCCRDLAKLIGQEDFGSELSALTERPGPEGRKETLESVMRAGRAAGLSTAIIPAAAGQVCRPHRALAGGEEQEETITLQAPLLDRQVRHETLSRQAV